MTDFDEELAVLRADVVAPDAAATERISARLSRSVGELALSGTSAAKGGVPWASPLKLVASFVIGGIVGAGVFSVLRPPRVERLYLEQPPPIEPVAVARTVPQPEPVALPTPTIPSSKSPALLPVPGAAVERKASLAEQQALLDVARVAYARGDYPQTLQTLATHSRRFPKSVLAEEREALQIKALAASDRLSDARERALRFQDRYPQSLLLPSIKDSVGAIP